MKIGMIKMKPIKKPKKKGITIESVSVSAKPIGKDKFKKIKKLLKESK